MSIRHLATALVATLLWGIPASAQSAADLLQKGIYAQETLGDLDGAVKSYRQVLTSYPANKQIAAQAQYQLVLCMVQKGDRAAASREFDALARNYPDQADIIAKARKLVPAGAAILPAPWPDGETFQLNIKRDGAFTGEYLFYTTGPNPYPQMGMFARAGNGPAAIPDNAMFYWKLVTKRSTRSLWVVVDRETMQPLDKPHLDTDDDMGDATAVPFAGPAVDLEPLIFRMRRLPLAAGYKTTLTTQPFVLGDSTPRQVELTVTGTETVEVVAGKFNCYKVSIGALGQTFWIGVDGARPLVKMQSGKVEAELVKVWGPSVFDSAMAFLKTTGWTWRDPDKSPGQDVEATVNLPDGQYFSVHLQKTYTPPGDIAQALRQAMAEKSKALSGLRSAREVTVRPDSVQTRLIGGQQALICLIDTVDHSTSTDGVPVTNEYYRYYAWVRTEGTAIEFSFGANGRSNVALFRFRFEAVLATANIP
jgi:hypothetical protein